MPESKEFKMLSLQDELLLNRRRKILSGVTPAIEHSQQLQQTFQAVIAEQHSLQLEKATEDKPKLKEAHDNPSLYCKEFIEKVKNGTFQAPKMIVDKYPDYFQPARLITSIEEPTDLDQKEEIFWIKEPSLSSTEQSELVDRFDYELWYKKPGKNQFEPVSFSGENQNSKFKGFAEILANFSFTGTAPTHRILSPSAALKFRKIVFIDSPSPGKWYAEQIALEKELTGLWNRWLGHISSGKFREEVEWTHCISDDATLENPLVQTIKLSAAKKLLEHFSQSQFGLDFAHLPEGFILQKTVLNYFPDQQTISSGSVRVEVTFLPSVEDKEEKIEFKSSQLREQEWWDYFYTKHFTHNPHDSSPEVLRAYKAFLAYIKQHKLSLPAVHFSEQCLIQSLPLALGRIISLLQNCKQEDRQQQLDFVPFLDLGNTGAIRAINTPVSAGYLHCRFVHPEMRCTEKNSGNVHGYKTCGGTAAVVEIENYSAKRILLLYRSRNRDTDRSSAYDSAKETFWRYLAHHDGLPLAFYLGNRQEENPQGAVLAIEKFTDDNIKVNLYCLLATLTTGAGLARGRDSQKILQQWQSLCDLINLLTKFNIKIAKAFLKNLHSLPSVPPIDLLDKILILCKAWIMSGKTNLINNSFTRLNKLLTFIAAQKLDPNILYHGMRFTVSDAKQNSDDPFTDTRKSLFLDYLDKFEYIQQTTNECRIIGQTRAVSFLFQSCVTFSLNDTETVDAYMRILSLPILVSPYQLTPQEEILFIEFQKACLDLLNQINSSAGLGKKDLNILLEEITSIYTERMKNESVPPPSAATMTIYFIDFLTEKYSEHFPPGFLQNQQLYFKNGLLTQEVCKLIGSFPLDQQNNVRSLLLLHAKEEKVYEETVNNLILLFEMCDRNALDFTDCLERLVTYKKAQSQSHGLQDLNRLFLLILQEGTLSPLESLLYHPDMQKIPGLIKKALLLYQTVSPWINHNQDRISPQLAYTPICDVFLAAPPDELDKEHNTILSSACDQLVQSLSKTLEETTSLEEKTKSNLLLELSKLLRFCPQDKALLEVREIILQSDKALAPDENKPYAIIKEKIGRFISQYNQKSKSFENFILNYYDYIYTIIEKKPKVKRELLNYISYFSQQISSQVIAVDDKKSYPVASYTQQLAQQVVSLQKAADHLSEEELRSLLYHGQRLQNPDGLMDFLRIIEENFTDSNSTLKNNFYHLLAKLIGEKAPVSTDKTFSEALIISVQSFQNLCKLVIHCPTMSKSLLAYYSHPPYKPLELVLGPCISLLEEKNETKEIEVISSLETQYHFFDAKPFSRDPKNHFELEQVKAQANRFSPNDLFTDEILVAIKKKIDFYRKKTTTEKILSLNQLKNELSDSKEDASPLQIANLTVLITELLFSTTNQEFNPTQLLVLYNQLASKGTVTYQISTGAGKSRIGMALCAGLVLLGQNPDFVTETMKLAEKDYYKTKPFFNACGIDTLLIDVETPLDEYFSDSKPLIGFSGKDQLGSFHNKINSQKKKQPAKKNPVLVMDEADVFYADNGKLHFNLSTRSDELHEETRWAYSFIYEFIHEDSFYDNYINPDLAKVHQAYRYFRYLPLRASLSAARENLTRYNLL